jgi:hypothetical protein
MEAILEAALPLPRPLAIEPIPYTAEGMMDRARRFVALAGEAPSRRFLEGVCVRGGSAWASNGNVAARLPITSEVPEGLHLYGSGWAEKDHEYPDMLWLVRGLGIFGLDAEIVPMCARFLRALAEHVVARAEARASDVGVDLVPAVVVERPRRQLSLGSVFLSGHSREEVCRDSIVVAPAHNDGARRRLCYDSRYLIPALIGCGPVVGLATADTGFSPLLLVRADGEQHFIMPVSPEDDPL